METSQQHNQPTGRRRGPGRPFVKGQVANPNGRNGHKRRYSKTITQMAREASPKMMRTMIAIAEDIKAPPGVRLTAADKVLDRAWGRPEQHRSLSVGFGRLSDLSDEALLAILDGRDDGPPLIEAQPIGDSTGSSSSTEPEPQQDQ